MSAKNMHTTTLKLELFMTFIINIATFNTNR